MPNIFLPMVTKQRFQCCLWHLLCLICCCAVGGNGKQNAEPVCGGVFEEPKGVIHTPNFPGPYPTPIYCEWLIHAPPGKKIFIYFTQFYMKDSFYVTEYDHFQDTQTYLGRHDLGRISWEHDLLSLAAYKPYVLIQFSVESIGNRHLRVIDHLLEVYGFNITYEITSPPSDISVNTKNTCSVKECSYLGNCLVNADFSKYECQCFKDFFGEHCQYGPYCDPDNDINQCTNGGRCKYFFGSLINQCECPPGFAGAYCEIPASGNGPELAKECIALKCSHLCDIDSEGKAYCVCYDGYKMHEDNGTCIPIARYRIDVELDLYSFISVKEENVDSLLEDAKADILTALEDNGIFTISKIGMEGLRNTTMTTSLEFYFYCKVSEVDHVEEAIENVVKLGAVGSFRLKQTVAHVEKSPKLLLSEVTNYDPNPTLRGKLLTLVCAAKGSKNISFVWYKDEHKVDTSLTQRNAWESVIPHTVHGMQLSVLNIDDVSPLDQGLFTCEVTDFGETQWGSVGVKVNDYPKVELDPMSLSIRKGESISIKCLSPDDSWLKFLYEWFKNGVMIDPNGRNEYAEDMFPTGVRLVVPRATQHAEYTCRVTNEAGSANVSAYVYVIAENETGQFCPRNYEGQVMWQNTSGGHFDIQRCPTEQGDYIRSGPVNVGYTRRYCKCDAVSSECKWSKPNFAKCQSLVLIHIFDELILLRYGYQQTTLKKVFDDLYKFNHPQNQVILYSGDIDMVSIILKELIQHMKNFPQLVKQDKKISAKELVDLISTMLVRSSTATDDEKKMLLVGPNIIQVASTLFSGAIDSLEYSPERFLAASSIELFKMKLDVIREDEETDIGQPSRHVQLRSADNKYNGAGVDVLSFKFKFLSDLLSYRDTSSSKQNRHHLAIVSDVLSLALYHGGHSSVAETIQISINHTKKINVSGPNTTICLSWSYDPRNLYNGEWKSDTCTSVDSAATNTICNCKLPGHFVAAIVPSNRTIISGDYQYTDINVPLLICYSFSLLVTIVAVFIYLRTFWQLVGDIHVVHLSFILNIFCICLVTLICMIHRSGEMSERATWRILLIFFNVAALACIVLESFYILITVFNIGQIQMSKLKYVIGCWGIPLAVTGVIFIVSRTLDLNHSCHVLCWLSTDMMQLYAFLIAAVLLILGFIISTGFCLWSVTKWTEEWRYAERQKHLKSMAKSSVLLTLLVLSFCLGFGLKSHSQVTQMVFHIVFHISLCLSVLIFRCILDKHIRFIMGRICFGDPRKNLAMKSVKSSSSFRAFMKPGNITNVAVSEEEYNVSKYYEEVNRKKYTTERKRQLSSLLGSSNGSGESTEDSKSTTVTISGSSAYGSGEGETVSSTTYDENTNGLPANDSGIFDLADGTGNIADSSCKIEHVGKYGSKTAEKGKRERTNHLKSKAKPHFTLGADKQLVSSVATTKCKQPNPDRHLNYTVKYKGTTNDQVNLVKINFIRNPLSADAISEHPSLFKNTTQIQSPTTIESQKCSEEEPHSKNLNSNIKAKQLNSEDVDIAIPQWSGVTSNKGRCNIEVDIECDIPDENSALIIKPCDGLTELADNSKSSCSSKLLSLSEEV